MTSCSRSGVQARRMPPHLDPATVEPAVERDRVHHQARERDAPAQLADEPGRVEGGAARQLVAVEQDDVTLAELRKVVGDRRAADAAADDHDPGTIGKSAGLRHQIMGYTILSMV